MKCSVCTLPDQTKCELYASCMEAEYVNAWEQKDKGAPLYFGSFATGFDLRTDRVVPKKSEKDE